MHQKSENQSKENIQQFYRLLKRYETFHDVFSTGNQSSSIITITKIFTIFHRRTFKFSSPLEQNAPYGVDDLLHQSLVSPREKTSVRKKILSFLQLVCCFAFCFRSTRTTIHLPPTRPEHRCALSAVRQVRCRSPTRRNSTS